MKTLLVFAALATISAFGQTSVTKKKASAKTAPKPAAVSVAKPLVIPPDATANPDGTYSWADKGGKKWTFQKTPFGVSKIEDTGGAPSAFASAPVGQFVKVTDLGEKVRFERQSPFGTTKWEKAKSELTDEERAIIAAKQQQSAPAPQKPE